MIKKILLGGITLYQNYISPATPKTCRFYPTCSEYSRQAILKYGLLRGGLMAIKRIIRCHPLHPGGVDKLE
ncbi:MAG: membrane protein insertion efficiency factor YidD [Candidatus Bipolaricaulota bacterium]